MQIQSVNVHKVSALTGYGQSAKQTASATFTGPKAGEDAVSISAQARALAESSVTEVNNAAKAVFNTDQGDIDLDIDAYFTPKEASLDELPPVLLPSKRNIDALSSHISSTLAKLMDNYSIPEAPETIRYDHNGTMVLPEDYPYADEFNAMLDENPALERELSTVNALSSHYAGIKEALAFQEEYRNASQAELNAVVAKYDYLFSDQQSTVDIALKFSPDGSLSISADGKSLA